MRATLRHLLSFLIVGAIAFVVDLCTYTLLTRSSDYFLHHYIAVSFIASLIAVLLGYLLNSLWTFGHPLARRTLQRYGLVYVSGIMLQSALLGTAVHWWHWYDIIAKIVAIVIVALCWNFPLAKWWVFRYDIA